MTDWKTYRLGELVNIFNGYAFKSSDFIEDGVPVIKIKNVKPSSINFNDLSFVSSKFLKSRPEYLIRPTDILITMSGNRIEGSPESWVGKAALFKHNGLFFLNQRVSVLRLKDEINYDVRFISYLLSSMDAQLYFIRHSNSSGGQANISPTILSQYTFKLPPLGEQKKIAGILSALDDKIETNRRIIARLEELAQALFKSWFIDFEPFGGSMPQDWKMKPLSDIATFLNGLAMQKFPPLDIHDRLPVLKIKELGQGFTDSNSDFCSKSNVDPIYHIEDADIIFSWSGTLLVKMWTGGICGLNQHLFKVYSSKYPKWFYYYWTLYHNENFKRIAKDKAVTMGHIKRGELNKAMVAVPPADILDKISQIISPILDNILSLSKESARLAALRDTLLPKLMSGEIIPE